MKPQFVEFKTKDGLTLPGLLYRAKNSKKVVIYLHGNGSSSIFYDESENRDLPKALTGAGFSLLKFNNRGAHIIKKFTIKKKRGEERLPYGMAFEKIKGCVLDIDAAVKFLQKLGYKEFHLAGASTGANKICVYNHYKPHNKIAKYILICGGDDTGIYYSILGKEKFISLLKKSKEKIKAGRGEEIAVEMLPFGEIFSYQGFYDIANPDGDYNCFPFSEAFGMASLSKKPLFAHFREIKKPSLVIYGEDDEYSWGDINRVITTLKKYQPKLQYKIIKGADHRFTGKKKELAKVIRSWLTTSLLPHPLDSNSQLK